MGGIYLATIATKVIYVSAQVYEEAIALRVAPRMPK